MEKLPHRIMQIEDAQKEWDILRKTVRNHKDLEKFLDNLTIEGYEY